MLFDQGTPVPLRRSLTGHADSTAFEMGWAELANGLSARRQSVAHAGLDRKHSESGSLKAAVRIRKIGTRHLRTPLFLPARVASRHEPRIRAFYEKLLARGKKPMQALVAIMRKLLHAIHGMFQNNADFDGTKCLAEGA